MLEQDLVKEKLTEADIEDMMMKTFKVTFGSTIVRHVDTPQQEKPALQAFGFTPETKASTVKAPMPNQRWEDISDLFLTPSKKVAEEKAKQAGVRSPEECTVMYSNCSSRR